MADARLDAQAAETAEVSKIDTAIKSAADSLEAAIAVAVSEATDRDKTLADDYAELERLLAERKANAVALSAVQQRVAMKEGPEVRQARLRKQILALPAEQLQRLARGGRG